MYRLVAVLQDLEKFNVCSHREESVIKQSKDYDSILRFFNDQLKTAPGFSGYRFYILKDYSTRMINEWRVQTSLFQ